MKLSVFLLLCSIGLAQATDSYAQKATVNLEMRNQTVKEVLDEIEEQSDFSFFFNIKHVDLHRRVSVVAKKSDIFKVLETVFAGTDVRYSVVDRKIILSTEKQEIQQINQDKKVTGVIKDQNGEPVIGANVSVKGTTIGTITGIDGDFALEVPANAVIQVSYIGYVSQELRLGGKDHLSIVLKEDLQALDEIVVVGYGVQKKVNLTGSVSSIKSEELERQPIVTMKDALAGLAPGMTVVKSSGQPGSSNPTITVRGVGTWQNAGPLVLVDGMSMNIADVLPNDIESISVLKDAASAAIYGSRAANGVILITTKKGKAGKIQVNYNGNVGWQQATRQPKLATGWQYAELYNRAMLADGKALPDGTTLAFPQDKIDRMKNGTGNIDHNEANTDWYDELLQTALQHTHDLSISGGNDRLQYVGTVGYAKQDGIIRSSYERYNTRLNTTANLANWLTLQSNIAYINDVSKESPGIGYAYVYVPRSFPNMPVKYSDGTWSFHSTPKNPVRMVTDDYGYQRYETDKLSLLFSPEIKLFDNSLFFKGVLGYESKTSYVDKFEKKVVYDAFEPAGQGENIFVARNTKTDTWYRNRNLTLSATANYVKSFGDHDVNLLLGASREQFRYNTTVASRKDFPNNDFEVINPGDASTATASGNKTYSALISVFGRINYSYKDRYLFEANIRRDGSSKFARGHRWGTFPSFSAAWRISEESFFSPLKNAVQNLKLRASWGKLGNQSIDNYLSMSTYNVIPGSSRFYMFDGTTQTLMSENVMGNNIITWETSTNLNFGLDVNVFDSRLGFTFDWYNRNTDDILLSLEAPSLLGITPPISNAGKVRNRGWELTVNWQDQVSDDFSYNVSFMLSDVKNKILDLHGYKSPTSDLTTRIEGEPIDALFGWKTLGLADTQEKYEQYKDVMLTYNSNFSMGDIIIEDLDEDGKITEADKTIIGNQIPRYTFSLNLGFNYKAFDFSAMFQGVGKADGFLGRDIIEPLGSQTAMEDHYYDSFDPSNPVTGKYYPRMTLANRLNYANMSHWVQDASYLRLKNLQVGYTFKFGEKIPLERARVYFSGSNLFTLTKYRVFDPENQLNTSSFPNVRVYSVGASVTF
ncbi:TonB-dependent receptor [Parabacteroides segnis]|uniref:TonB-dependent receptor n=1 Tax=Parabacteroides segnis TaxID=2763058 RepID=UPI00351542D6